MHITRNIYQNLYISHHHNVMQSETTANMVAMATRRTPSPRNIAALVTGLFIGLATGLLIGLATGLITGFPVGLLVDFPVGLLVGFPVGLLVDSPVGLLVGFPVGLLVGFPVGLLVGFPVGLLVDSPVGLLVGFPVGLLVGFPVGLLVDSPVGLLDGFSVGLLVGFAVGFPATKKFTICPNSQWLPTSHANVNVCPASDSLITYSVSLNTSPTNTASVCWQSPDGWMNTLWRWFWAHSKEILSPTEASSSGKGTRVAGMNHSKLILGGFAAWVVGVCVRKSRVRGRRRVGDIMFGCFWGVVRSLLLLSL